MSAVLRELFAVLTYLRYCLLAILTVGWWPWGTLFLCVWPVMLQRDLLRLLSSHAQARNERERREFQAMIQGDKGLSADYLTR